MLHTRIDEFLNRGAVTRRVRPADDGFAAVIFTDSLAGLLEVSRRLQGLER